MKSFTSFGTFAALRGCAQVLTFVAGIIIVRTLAPEDYALYSIATSLIAAVTTVSATGIASRFMALAAAVPRPSRELDTIYNSARAARMRLATVVMLLVAPLLVYLLTSNGASLEVAIGMTLLVAACILPLQQYGLTTSELQLQRKLVSIGAIDVLTNLLRVILISIAWVASWASALSLTLISALIAWAQASASSRRTRDTLRRSGVADVATRTSFSIAVKQSLPAVLVMVASEQMVTLLLTWSGNTTGIAEIAALSRYALAFALLNNILGTWGASYMARAAGGRRTVLRASARYLGIYTLACIVFLALVTLGANPLLALLGPHYANLQGEFLVLMVGATVSNLASFGIGALNHSRGYLRYSWTYIPLVAIWLTLSIFLVDTSTGIGAAVLTASLALPQLVSQLVRAVHGIATHGEGRAVQ